MSEREDKPITEAEFAAAHLRFSRNVAIILCAALAEGGAAIEQVNRRLGKRGGYVESIIAKLISGKQMKIDPVGSILWAAGGFLLDFTGGQIGFRRVEFTPPPTSEDRK